MKPHAARRQRLAEHLREHSLPAALITKPASVYYLTGHLTDPHERFMGLFVFPDGEAAFVISGLEREAACRAFDPVLTWTDTQGPRDAITSALGGRAPKQLAVEKEHLTLERVEMFREMLPGITFAAISGAVDGMRAIKDAAEIAIMRRAARMIDDAIAGALTELHEGMTEIALAAAIERRARALGASGMSFGTCVLSGAKSALPHGKTNSDPIRDGEYLLIDAGVVLDGYASDITRTYIVGEPSARHREIHALVLKAQRAALAATRPGVRFGDADKAARDIITAGGYGPQFIHRLGHGLGLETHEWPSVHGKNEETMAAGMVFTIEPGIYVEGFGGVRIEDDVLVTEHGAEEFTALPRSLDECRLSLAPAVRA